MEDALAASAGVPRFGWGARRSAGAIVELVEVAVASASARRTRAGRRGFERLVGYA
jgi:hypothetical protein